MRNVLRGFSLSLASMFLAFGLAHAPPALAEEPSFSLKIQDHRFVPEVLEVPAGQRFRLIVENADATPEEFESYELNREKVIPGRGKGTVYIAPLSPGSYPFFGEFHPDTAKGRIVAK
jgi:hypothetical protein